MNKIFMIITVLCFALFAFAQDAATTVPVITMTGILKAAGVGALSMFVIDLAKWQAARAEGTADKFDYALAASRWFYGAITGVMTVLGIAVTPGV
jgi:hypothetical protein